MRECRVEPYAFHQGCKGSANEEKVPGGGRGCAGFAEHAFGLDELVVVEGVGGGEGVDEDLDEDVIGEGEEGEGLGGVVGGHFRCFGGELVGCLGSCRRCRVDCRRSGCC